MPQYLKIYILIPVFLLVTVPLWAQEGSQKEDFNLSRTATDSLRAADSGAIEVEEYTPKIEAGKIEVTLTLGFLDLNKTLLSHDQIIYKFIDEATYWGDVELNGEPAFNPILALDYNLSSWFALEPYFSLSVSQYSATITNRSRRPNEEGAPIDDEEPPLEDFDAEERSVISLGFGLNGILYPLNFGNSEGRWHPFLIGGVSRFWLDLNSNYTDDPSKSWMASGGIGLRFVADDLISIRLQVLYNHTTLKFTPAQVFDALDEGTRTIPVLEFPVIDGVVTERRVEEYASTTLNTLTWGIGFTASF